MSLFVKILNFLGFDKKSNRKLSKELEVWFDSVEVREPQFTEGINKAIDEYAKKYNFGEDVINNTNPHFDLLSELIRYLHTRFDDNGWNENDVFNELPTWYRHAYLAFALDAEVQNGGLGQYFTNSAGKHARDTILAFDIMGAGRLSAFLQAAIEINKEYEKLENKNADESEYLIYDERMSFLDSQYYAGLDEKLFEFVDAYIKKQMKLSGETCFVIP